MSQPTTKSVDDVIAGIEQQELHPTRQLAHAAVAKYRRGTAIDSTYDFSVQSKELRQVVYDGIVRFSRRRLWSRILR